MPSANLPYCNIPGCQAKAADWHLSSSMHLVYSVIHPSMAAVMQLAEEEENQPYDPVKRDIFQAYRNEGGYYINGDPRKLPQDPFADDEHLTDGELSDGELVARGDAAIKDMLDSLGLSNQEMSYILHNERWGNEVVPLVAFTLARHLPSTEGTCDLFYHWRSLSVLYPSPTQQPLPASEPPASSHVSQAEADLTFMQEFSKLRRKYKQFMSTEEMEDFLTLDEGSDTRRRHPLKALFLKQLAEAVSDFRMIDMFRPGYKETTKWANKRHSINLRVAKTETDWSYLKQFSRLCMEQGIAYDGKRYKELFGFPDDNAIGLAIEEAAKKLGFTSMSQTEDHLLSLAPSDEVFIAFNRHLGRGFLRQGNQIRGALKRYQARAEKDPGGQHLWTAEEDEALRVAATQIIAERPSGKKIGHRLQKAENLTEAEAKAISDNVQELGARSWKWLHYRYNTTRIKKRKTVNVSDEDDDIGQPGPGPSTQRRLRKAKKVDYGFQSSDEGER